MTAVAVIGLGAMGSRIARRLLDAGHDLTVWNRTASRAAPLAELGAAVAGTPADATVRADAVITMISDPAALDDVASGPNGIAAAAGPDTTVIQMATVGLDGLRRLGSTLPDGTGLLDSPVLGSITEAESGTLRIFVGGPQALAERWEALLQALGEPIRVGPLGAGSAAKLVANHTLFGSLGVLGEALALAEHLALPPDVAFEVLATTPVAAQAERRRPAIESGTYPPRFGLALARKDAELVMAAAAESGADLRLAEAARSWLADAEAAGLGEQDYSAVLGYMLHRPGSLG